MDGYGGGETMDYEKVAAPVKSAVDKFKLLPEFLKVIGLVKEQLDSFNYFVETGIKKIVRANNKITAMNNPDVVYIRFLDIKIGEPIMMVDGAIQKINPHTCRLSDWTYSAPILLDIEYPFRKSIVQRRNVQIGKMPIMLRSCRCILNGKDEAELAKLGECPLDPGGYFVIKGNEKVLLIQEQLSKNRIIIETNKKGNIIASVTSSSENIKSKTVISYENERFYLELNRFSSKIPIMIVFKAMGMESDQEVAMMLGRDPRFTRQLLFSIQECMDCGIINQQQALKYLEKKMKRWTVFNTDTEEGEIPLDILLQKVFLANVPVHQNNFRPKCLYVVVMLRRILEAFLNKDAMDDKDYVGNKRLELSGQLISLLFEDLFKTMISMVQKNIDGAVSKATAKAGPFDPSFHLSNSKMITFGLERALSTGNFDIKRFKMHRKGMTQGLNRLSFIGTLGHMTKIQPQFEKSRKVSGPRALQPSQWGMLCPADTPEGESCGLVKNLALTTHVTTDEEDGPLIHLLLF